MVQSLGKELTILALLAADAVAFDVDSTVQDHEGIDRLAEHCGRLEQVQRLTRKAMQGEVLFQVRIRMPSSPKIHVSEKPMKFILSLFC
jgi:phosphoserine phosphatase